jgi:hypothetical protein
MNYKNYDTAIVELLKVKLVGWPGTMVSPSEMTSITELRTLRDALKSGACKWIKMPKVQLDTHAADLGEARKRRDHREETKDAL